MLKVLIAGYISGERTWVTDPARARFTSRKRAKAVTSSTGKELWECAATK
jgi:hypothetical protein